MTFSMALTNRQLAIVEKCRHRLVSICEKFPEVEIQVVGERHLAFRIRKKTFGYYQLDHHGDGEIAFCCKSNLSEQRRQVRIDPATFFVPAYLGQRGWIAIRLDSDQLDWEVVEQFARTAYQLVAPRRLAVQLE
jgi:predicted DNA-binding protein (MmcQ/YjbR family)